MQIQCAIRVPTPESIVGAFYTFNENGGLPWNDALDFYYNDADRTTCTVTLKNNARLRLFGSGDIFTNQTFTFNKLVSEFGTIWYTLTVITTEDIPKLLECIRETYTDCVVTLIPRLSTIVERVNIREG